MALRTIRILGDEILSKPCREVSEMTPRQQELIWDMLETMYDADGLGLAAPQVGVLRRIAVIDVNFEDPDPLILVNPVITRREGEQTGDEGCLSFPGKVGTVSRPAEVTVRYFDENMDEYELDAEGLLARAICHEVDHLDGHMYVEFVEGEIRETGHGNDEDEEPGEDEFDEEFEEEDLDEEEYEYEEYEDEEESEPQERLKPRLIRRHDEPEAEES